MLNACCWDCGWVEEGWGGGGGACGEGEERVVIHV